MYSEHCQISKRELIGEIVNFLILMFLPRLCKESWCFINWLESIDIVLKQFYWAILECKQGIFWCTTKNHTTSTISSKPLPITKWKSGGKKSCIKTCKQIQSTKKTQISEEPSKWKWCRLPRAWFYVKKGLYKFLNLWLRSAKVAETTHLTFTCSKLTIEREKGVKYVRSWQ